MWGEWGDFTSCSKTCGGGEKFRYRTISQQAYNGGNNCEGNSVDIQLCNVDDCTGELQICFLNIETVWGQYSNFSALPVGRMGSIHTLL